MKIAHNDGERLVLESSPAPQAGVLGAGVLMILFLGVGRENYGLNIILAAACLPLFLLLRKRRVEFLSRDKIVRWEDAGLVRKEGGAIAYADIEMLILSAEMSDTGRSTSYTFMLALKNTRGFFPLSRIATNWTTAAGLAPVLCAALGQKPERLLDDSLRALVRHGQEMNAVRLLADRRQLSSTEAHRQIEKIKADLESGGRA